MPETNEQLQQGDVELLRQASQGCARLKQEITKVIIG